MKEYWIAFAATAAAMILFIEFAILLGRRLRRHICPECTSRKTVTVIVRKHGFERVTLHCRNCNKSEWVTVPWPISD